MVEDYKFASFVTVDELFDLLLHIGRVGDRAASLAQVPRKDSCIGADCLELGRLFPCLVLFDAELEFNCADVLGDLLAFDRLLEDVLVVAKLDAI